MQQLDGIELVVAGDGVGLTKDYEPGQGNRLLAGLAHIFGATLA